jgi:amino acid transporter
LSAQFYILSMVIVGLLVPYNHPSLISRSSVDSKASPFVIAITEAGLQGLDSVMNAVIMISVLSVANSALFGSSRTLAALAEQGQAPQILAYIDKKGRPLVSIAVASSIGLIAYLSLSDIAGQAFTWLLALSGLSCIFTWASICLSHIRFRQAWKAQGHSLNELAYKSSVGVIGSWIGFVSLIVVLVVQLWVAVDPIGGAPASVGEAVAEFFAVYLGVPIVLLFYGVYKAYYRTPWISTEDIDLQSGKNEMDPTLFMKVKEDKASWPTWKVVYNALC